MALSSVRVQRQSWAARCWTVAFTRRGIASGRVLAVGLKLMTAGSVVLLAITLSDLRSPALLTGLLIVVALAFGLSLPNVMNATMQPLPEIAGAVSAAAGSI